LPVEDLVIAGESGGYDLGLRVAEAKKKGYRRSGSRLNWRCSSGSCCCYLVQGLRTRTTASAIAVNTTNMMTSI